MGALATVMSNQPYFFLSIFDKDRCKEAVRGLVDLDEYRLLGTEGTAEWCEQQGWDCRSVSDLLDLSPRLDGQVKTLHPDLYTAILGRNEAGTGLDFDLAGVFIDLTPFEQGDGHVRRTKIDIGGVGLLRAAAKNHQQVIPLSDPDIAKKFVKEFPPTDHARQWLASRILRTTIRYDKQWLSEWDQSVGNGIRSTHCSLPARNTLRYGENPDQRAYYRQDLFSDSQPEYSHRGGDDLSYTNLLDADAARNLAEVETGFPWTISVIKHTNPTGWATGEAFEPVFESAWQGDPKSAFGGVVGVNRPLTPGMLEQIDQQFVEVLVAPDIAPETVETHEGASRPRLVEYQSNSGGGETLRSLGVDYLTQTELDPLSSDTTWEIVACPDLANQHKTALRQMWQVARWVTSNAAVVGSKGKVLGVGAGQQSRVDAVQIATDKRWEHNPAHHEPTVLASDGFFPFPDNIELAADAGIEAIISPGGSVKDEEVLVACEKYNIGMIFTGQRIFEH